MKRLTILCALCACTIGASADPPLELSPTTAATMTNAEWAAYSDVVSDALTDARLKATAVRMIIQYSAFIPVDRSDVIELARLYRDDERPAMRRMASVAIGALNDDWGMDFLVRSFAFEDDPAIKHTIGAVLLAHGRAHRILVEQPTVIGPVS